MGKVTNLILSSNPIYKDIFVSLNKKTNYNWLYLEDKKKLTKKYLNSHEIKKIFVPHWSNIITENIYKNYECILFHMTDLPFGRGGSPLQNLIKLGKTKTKISALQVNENIDSGPIYLKKELNLNGTAKQIFKRASFIIEEMIVEILLKQLAPKTQSGNPTYFKRRTPNQSSINGLSSIQDLYDHIRMLDCDGYPKAYLEFDNFRIEFDNAILNDNKNLKANVRIKYN